MDILEEFMKELQSHGPDEGLPKSLIDKAIASMKDLYQKEHDEPVIEEPVKKAIELPEIPTLKGVSCGLCGKESVMDIPDKRKPCLVCGYVN